MKKPELSLPDRAVTAQRRSLVSREFALSPQAYFTPVDLRLFLTSNLQLTFLRFSLLSLPILLALCSIGIVAGVAGVESLMVTLMMVCGVPVAPLALFSGIESSDRQPLASGREEILRETFEGLLDLSKLPPLVSNVVPYQRAIDERSYELLAEILAHCAESQQYGMDFLLASRGSQLQELASLAIDSHCSSARDGGVQLQARLSLSQVKSELNEAAPRRAQWVEARRSHEAIIEGWTDILCDPLAALTRPALLNVKLPQTEEFITAYSAAEDLMRINGERYPGVPDDAVYIRAVGRLERAWLEALTNADIMGLAAVSENDRPVVERAVKFAATAQNSAATSHERALAAKHLNSILWGIESIQAPAQTLLAIKTAAKGELEARTI